jgi:hypothetical protein
MHQNLVIQFSIATIPSHIYLHGKVESEGKKGRKREKDKTERRKWK